MKQRVEEMEREANKLRELQAAAERASQTDSTEDPAGLMVTDEEKAAADGRSIYVGNVSAVIRITPPLLQLMPSCSTFHSCFARLITVLLRKKFRVTSKRAVRSTESPSSATSLLAIQRGTALFYRI